MDEKIRKQIIKILEDGEEIPAEYQEDLFPTTKKEYELKYAGKERKEVILNDTMSVPFQAIKHFGKISNGEWTNMLIFGDNLQALKHLLRLKDESKLKNSDGSNGIKLVYIDPPFATKQDFKGNQEQKAYQDKIIGAKFLEFLRKRLIFLKEILSDNGSIYVHLDYKKAHYAKTLLDEIFGEHNFRNEIITRRGQTKSLSYQFERITSLNVFYDTVFWYSKNQITRFNPPYKEALDYQKCGRWQSMWNNADRPTMRYELLGCEIDKGQWKWSKERACQAVENYKRFLVESKKTGETLEEYWNRTGRKLEFIRRNANAKPQYWVKPQEKVICDNDWLDIKGYDYSEGYPTQKSEKLLERIISASSNRGDIVLDCFAGSGTTLAVAEKLGRKWVGVDSSKLAIYTMQRRFMNLKEEIGNKGKALKPRPFTLYNAGLYHDGELLNRMQEDEYKDFVLELFGCQKRAHEINGLEMHGTLNNHPVMIFDKKHCLTEEFIDDLHKNMGKSIKDNLFLIAPVGIVGFNEDYIKKGNIKYTVLRIPNSIIAYIREKNFTRLEQPRTAEDINQTIDSVGFDFIYPPEVESKYFKNKNKYCIKIRGFEPIQLGAKIVKFKNSKMESLAMIMIDLNYNGKTFNLDEYYFSDEIVKNDYKITIDTELGDKIMVIYLDIFGNEKKEVVNKKDFRG